MKGTSRSLSAAVSMLLCQLASAQQVEVTRVAYSIEPQPMIQALREFGRQSDMQLLVRSDDVSTGELTSPTVSGKMTPEQALKRLLADTPLAYEFVNAKTVRISQADADDSAAQRTPGARTTTSSEHAAPAAAPENDASPGFDKTSRADDGPELQPNASNLAEVIVTGTHIRGAAPIGSNVITIDREDIKNSGYARLQDILDTVPQNITRVTETGSQDNVGNPTRGTEIQLRGLGPGSTLTLVNGRRQPAGGTLGAFTDISSIPASAVERIEILADGASAIYGSDAIGGVVNIILRRDFEGAETTVRMGSVDGDSDRLNIGQLFGARWSSGNVLLGYEYTKQDPLLLGDVEYYELNRDYRSLGGSDWRRSLSTSRGSNPGNILCPATGSFGCTPGQPAYAIPSGQNGRNLTTAQLLPGQINYFDTSTGMLQPEQEVHAAYLSATQELGERVELQADLRYAKRNAEAVLAGGQAATVTVPSTNPFYFNPFGGTAPVQVEYDFTKDLGPLTSLGEIESRTAALGATIRLAGDWQLQLSGSYGDESVDHLRDNRLNTANLNAALALTDPATALNVFGDGANNNPATIALLRRSSFDHAQSSAWSAGAKVDGSLFDLGGGAARLAVGLDQRGEDFKTVSTWEFTGRTDESRDVAAAFAELSLPLLAAHDSRRSTPRLALSLAARYDDYSDVGSTFNPRVGLQWLPFSALALRGSWGTSFRAPPFSITSEDIRPSNATVTAVNDPAFGGARRNVLTIRGVAPDITEETAKVWTAGFDLSLLSNLSFSATYFNIAYEDRIQSPGDAIAILAAENQFAAAGVVRRNFTQAEVSAFCNASSNPSACFAGAPFSAIVDQRVRNIALVEVDGVDLNVRYALASPLGAWTFGVGGAYLFRHEQAITAASPRSDLVDTFEGPPALRLQSSIGWTLGGWQANAIVHYTGSYRNTTVTPARELGAWTTLDVGAGYDFGSRPDWLSHVEIRFNATNVLDKASTFVDSSSDPYDRYNGGVIGRVASLQLVKAWN